MSVAVARRLAADGDEVRAVGPCLAHPSGEGGGEQGRIDELSGYATNLLGMRQVNATRIGVPGNMSGVRAISGGGTSAASLAVQDLVRQNHHIFLVLARVPAIFLSGLRCTTLYRGGGVQEADTPLAQGE